MSSSVAELPLFLFLLRFLRFEHFFVRLSSALFSSLFRLIPGRNSCGFPCFVFGYSSYFLLLSCFLLCFLVIRTVIRTRYADTRYVPDICLSIWVGLSLYYPFSSQQSNTYEYFFASVCLVCRSLNAWVATIKPRQQLILLHTASREGPAKFFCTTQLLALESRPMYQIVNVLCPVCFTLCSISFLERAHRAAYSRPRSAALC